MFIDSGLRYKALFDLYNRVVSSDRIYILVYTHRIKSSEDFINMQVTVVSSKLINKS